MLERLSKRFEFIRVTTVGVSVPSEPDGVRSDSPRYAMFTTSCSSFALPHVVEGHSILPRAGWNQFLQGGVGCFIY